jgi:hypothetical protein
MFLKFYVNADHLFSNPEEKGVADFEWLLDRISLRLLATGLRDRAVIALLLTHTSATIEGIVAMQVRDYYRLGDRRWVRLMAHGVERFEPVDPGLEAYIDEYLAVVRIEDDPSGPLFRHLLRDGKVTSRSMSPIYVGRMIRRRVTSARRSETAFPVTHRHSLTP